MNRTDASFTFLHRVEEVEWNIADRRWQSALALALTLPDICGGIAFPEMVKRYRDGRVMLDRQKNPTRDVGAQYIRWYDEFAAPYFKLSPSDERPYICGERCWQLRCEYLHQNKGFVNEEEGTEVRFHLGVNCGTSLCQTDFLTKQENGLDIRIDIEQFCLRMCQATRNYYDAVHWEKDFSLYNTPVLDFIQAKQKKISHKPVMIACRDFVYAEGIRLALKGVSDRIIVWVNLNEDKKRKGGSKPSLWIITEDMMEESEQPWRSDKGTPVIVLRKDVSNPLQKKSLSKNKDQKKDFMQKEPGKLTTLKMPFVLEELRSIVFKYL